MWNEVVFNGQRSELGSWGAEGRWGQSDFRKSIKCQVASTCGNSKLQLLLARSLVVRLSFGRPQAKEFHAPFLVLCLAPLQIHIRGKNLLSRPCAG